MSRYLAIVTPGLPVAVAAAMTFTTKSVYGPDGQFDGVVIDGAQLSGSHDERSIRTAILALEQACRPGGMECATMALSKLRSMTARRTEGEADQHFTGQSYAEAMAHYPRDVIEDACRRWADDSRWWPAWADLKRECDRLAAKRLAEHRALTEALRKVATPVRPQLEAQKPLPTLQERLRTSVVLRRQAGDDRTAAQFEVKLAKAENRPVAQWAQDAIAAQIAEQRAKAEEYRRVAEEPASAPAGPATDTDRHLADLAQQRRDQLLGIDRSEAAA